MAAPVPRDAIVVLQASVDDDDPREIVDSNVGFVNALREEYLTEDEIATDALRSYFVDFYLCQVENGGFSQFVYNSGWSPQVVAFIRDGMRAMGAKRHLAVFEEGARLVEEFGPDRLARYFESEYFGENLDRDALNAPNDAFFAAEAKESLLALNAAWLRAPGPLPHADGAEDATGGQSPRPGAPRSRATRGRGPGQRTAVHEAHPRPV